MSIVEKALAKLKASRRPERPLPKPPRSAPIVGNVVQRESGPIPAVREGHRREFVGHSIKRINLDYDALRLHGMLPPEYQERELANQYRTLKRPLIRHAFHTDEARAGGKHVSPRLIMVTSALPGEGKTFTSINLALSLAMEHDHGVVLVDGDAPKPHISHTFGVAGEPGLLDLISDPQASVESAVLSTNVPGLSILPAGRHTEMATELFASTRMKSIMTQLDQLDPQGLVVVDSPPILLTSEARVLASQFGQVLLIVKASSTPRQAVIEAATILGEGPRIGLVLNQAAHDEFGGNYYGYGFNYGHGNGRDDDGAAKAAASGVTQS